jgi:YhcH/YjgK/YiaL family protein
MIKNSLLLSLVLLSFSITKAQSKTETTSDKKTVTWFNKKEWLHGLKLTPHSSINKQELARQYAANTALWDKAFEFLKTNDLASLPVGRQPLVGDSAFVIVTEAVDKEPEQTQWESHKKYIDIQYIIRGKEKMGVAPVASATITNPYDESKDVANYTAEGKYYIAEPGTFFIFFPQDAHRPSIKVNDDKVKKIVIKVRAAEE